MANESCETARMLERSFGYKCVSPSKLDEEHSDVAELSRRFVCSVTAALAITICSSNIGQMEDEGLLYHSCCGNIYARWRTVIHSERRSGDQSHVDAAAVPVWHPRWNVRVLGVLGVKTLQKLC